MAADTSYLEFINNAVAVMVSAINSTEFNDLKIEDDSFTLTEIYVNDSNSSERSLIFMEHAPQLSKARMIKAYILLGMAILSLVGNILTIWNIYKTRISRRSTRNSWSAIYTLMFHLSIADILVAIFCIVGEAIWCYTVEWVAGESACKLMKLFQMFSLYLSTYILVLIGIDRWTAVKHPIKSLNTTSRCHRYLAITYAGSFLISIPQFFIFRVLRGPFIEEFHQCVTHGFYKERWHEQFYTTLTLIFTFVLPLSILSWSYISTFRTISNSAKMFEDFKFSGAPVAQLQPNNLLTNRQRLIQKAKKKSMRISITIIIAFVICWMPYNIMMILFMFWNPDKRIGDILQNAIFFFGMSNSLVNPLIYGAFHLFPASKKKSRADSKLTHSFNRMDSQRSGSMNTALTQVDDMSHAQNHQHRFCRSVSKCNQECFRLLDLPTSKSNGMRKTSFLHHPPKRNGKTTAIVLSSKKSESSQDRVTCV